MTKEKETCCSDELYGGAPCALEQAEKEIENRRVYLKKIMKPAEEKAKQLEKDTATTEVRLQGTTEPKAPSLKPYTEEIHVKDRKDLGALIGKAKSQNKGWRVEKSLKEGYRYVFILTESEEKSEWDTLDLDSLEFEKVELNEGGNYDSSTSYYIVDGRIRVSDEATARKEADKIGPGTVVNKFTRHRNEMDDTSKLEDEGIVYTARRKETAKSEPKETKQDTSTVYLVPGTETIFTSKQKAIEWIKNHISFFKRLFKSPKDLGLKEVSRNKVCADIFDLSTNVGSKKTSRFYYYDKNKNKWVLEVGSKLYNILESKETTKEEEVELEITPEEDVVELGTSVEETPSEESEMDVCDVLANHLDLHGNGDHSVTVCLKGDLDNEDAVKLTINDLSDEEYEILKGAFHSEGEQEESEQVDNLEEASSAEKKAYKHGGEVVTDLIRGRAIARIKDPEARRIAASAAKIGRTDVVDQMTGERKQNQADVALQKKMDAMQKAGVKDDDSFLNDFELDESLLKEEETTVNDNLEIKLDDLQYFKPCAGARDTWKVILDNNKLEELAKALGDFAKDGKMTTTDLNDLLWFEKEWVYDTLEINPLIKHGDDVIDAEIEGE